MSVIMSVLGLTSPSRYLRNVINLYHIGDSVPFANVYHRDGKIHIRVNAGEAIANASNISLGRYVGH